MNHPQRALTQNSQPEVAISVIKQLAGVEGSLEQTTRQSKCRKSLRRRLKRATERGRLRPEDVQDPFLPVPLWREGLLSMPEALAATPAPYTHGSFRTMEAEGSKV